ncbi:hypothetical protein BV20DRAFT_1056171 [Pilatotrama ljubarskyi]|nr:hypothetical protein BV20DRAFT_1056171 [Pilatotrama ljubarskyi]
MNLLLILFSVLTAVYGCDAARSLVPKKFVNLPLGNVKPAGWIQSHIGNDGTRLGTDRGFYTYLSHANTEWVSKSAKLKTVYTIEGAGSLWFNDMVTVAGVVGIPVVQSQVEQFLDYFIDSQDSDGWIGPEVNTTKPRQLSARFPFFLGAIRIAEAQPARCDRVAVALHKFATLVNKMLHHGEGIDDESWAFAGDFLVALQWLYEFHPNDREEFLLETMAMLMRSDDSWSHLFRAENFPAMSMEGGQLPDVGTYWRAMKAANALMAVGARYRLDGGKRALQAVHDAWDSLFDGNAEPAGMFIPYVREDGFRHHERMHVIVETMRSASYLYEVTGHPKFANALERILHNAFWAVRWIFTTGWSVHSGLDYCRGWYLEDGPYYDLFKGMTHDISCEVPSYPAGLPDVVYDGFLVTPDRTSLVQAQIGPFAINTTLAGGNKVSVTVDTAYPYGAGESTSTIVAAKEFRYFVRVPGWSENATISVNGSEAQRCTPMDGLHMVTIAPGVTKVVLDVPIAIQTETRRVGLVAVRRGQILYCLDPHAQDGDSNAGVEEPRYAIDPTTAKTGALPRKYFQMVPGMPRIQRSVVVAACPVASSEAFGELGHEQDKSGVVCAGPVRNLTLTPYAGGYFPYDPRVTTEFPTFTVSQGHWQ